VLAGYRKLLAVRTTQPAFHPDGPQEPLQTGDAALVAFLRSAPDGEQRVLVAANVGPEPKPLDVASLTGAPAVRDLLADQHAEPRTDAGGRRVLAPYQVAWLEIDAG
jgi:sucrose phosphorylase